MEANFKRYDFEKSRQRIDEILEASDADFKEVDTMPSRSELTFSNGFYANCTVLFVDIRKSSDLANKHRRPTLAKIYRAFISEAVALVNGITQCREVSIEGDCVWAVFETLTQQDINDVFLVGASISSMVDVLSCKLKKKGYSELTVGIGMAYGRALMIKAGYSGSGINEVVWAGSVVGEGARLSSYGSREWGDKEFMLSSIIYQNLNSHNQSLLSWSDARECYHGNVINVEMSKWVEENCK